MLTQNNESLQIIAQSICGYETQISITSKQMKISVETPSKEKVYQATINYNDRDSKVTQQVAKTFTNLHLLFDYIQKFYEDPLRIKIDLKKQQIKIVKVQGLVRYKNSGVLIIPLERKQQLQTKPKSQIENQIEIASRSNRILMIECQELKGRRKLLIDQMAFLEKDINRLCQSIGVDVKGVDACVEKGLEQQMIGSFISKEKSLVKSQEIGNDDIKRLLEYYENSYQNQESACYESLFFQSQPQHIIEKNDGNGNENDHEIKREHSVVGKEENLIEDSSIFMSYDPFSYLF